MIIMLTIRKSLISGWKYKQLPRRIKSFNEYEIKLENGDILRIDDIVSITGEAFEND